MVTVSKYVDVDVDLDDFDTEELVQELQSRGLDAADKPADVEKVLGRLRLAIQIGQHDRVPDLARDVVNEYYGLCL